MVLNKLATGESSSHGAVQRVHRALQWHGSPSFAYLVRDQVGFHHHAENYTEVVHGGFETEVSGEYLMYTQGDGKVWNRT
jgi:UDP-N-acetylmuramyl tripeptide synthase